MSLAMKLVCDECGFEFENDGTDLFYIDPDTREIFDHRVMLREEDPSENALIKGDTFESYCSHCDKNVKLYSIREFSNLDSEEAMQVVLDALKRRPNNIKLSSRQKHRYFLSTIYELEIKDTVEDKTIKKYDVNDFESKEEAIETARFDFKELIEDMANYDIDDLKTDPEYIYVVELGTDYEDRQIKCPECGREIPRRINPFDKCPKCDGELELVSTMLLDGV